MDKLYNYNECLMDCMSVMSKLINYKNYVLEID